MTPTAKPANAPHRPDLRFPTSPVAFAVFVCLAALGARIAIPGSDPFQNYFQRYVRTGAQGRNRSLPARIAQMGPHAAEELSRILANDSAEAKELAAAARLAAFTGDKSLSPRLAHLAETSGEVEVRVAALESLAQLGGQVGADFLDRALGDPEPAIRAAALRAIGAPLTPAQVARLSELARSAPAEEERAQAIAALGRAGQGAGRIKLWEIYNLRLPLEGALAVKRALLAMPPPTAREQAALLETAQGYLPVPYNFPGGRARRRMEARLRTLLQFRAEDLLAESEEQGGCGNEEECHERHVYYRDLIRRKTRLELEAEAYQPLVADTVEKNHGESIIFVRSAWLLGGRVREAALSMVRLAGPDPAIFPLIELGFDTFARVEDAGAPAALSELGEVLRVTGQLRAKNLEVEVVRPVAGIRQADRYRFEGGIFVLVTESE